jgi:ribonuclease P protein component
MFKKSQRLSQSEFAAYFKTGKRYHSKYLTIITSSAHNRGVAVVVGKKVAKSAVRRNTLRRRVYATLRKELSAANYQAVMIVIVKPEFNSLSRKVADETVKREISQVLDSSS